MKDIQDEKDFRNIPLDKVGVSNVIYPIRILDKQHGFQNTVSQIDMFVDLPHDYRGTHMSRFLEVLNENRTNMSINNLEHILDEIKTILKAKNAHITVKFPYFVLKKAPVSKSESYLSYDCAFIASKGENFDFILEVNTPIHTLCPCSKEISEFSAHNQRANAKVQARMNKLVWIEDIIEISEKAASSPLFSLLKREDEKFVTEHAYLNPRFVEDVVREISLALEKDDRITYYNIEVVSFESIHNHNAYASFTRFKK